MGKNAKLGIAGLVVLILALGAYVALDLLLAVAILVLGALGIAVLKERLGDETTEPKPPKAEKGQKAPKGPKGPQGKRKLNDIVDAQNKAAEGNPSTAAPRGGGLPTWNPTALETWKPPSLREPDVVPEPEAPNQWAAWDNDWEQERDPATAEEQSPLEALDRLDDIDPIAEVERIERNEAWGGTETFGTESFSGETFDERPFDADSFGGESFGTRVEGERLSFEEEPERPATGASSVFSFSSAPKVINEEVSSADDIMAASQATELDAVDAGDSELAKLLAKVQARLAAYE